MTALGTPVDEFRHDCPLCALEDRGGWVDERHRRQLQLACQELTFAEGALRANRGRRRRARDRRRAAQLRHEEAAITRAMGRTRESMRRVIAGEPEPKPEVDLWS